jgi:hypothetical protein
LEITGTFEFSPMLASPKKVEMAGQTGEHSNQSVKIKVQPGQELPFPAVCVHCLQPAGERLRLQKRMGRVSRSIDVPLCASCAQEISRLSFEEERWQKLSWVIAILTWMIGLTIFILLLPAGLPFVARFMLAILVAAGLAVLAFKLGRRVAEGHARPEKQAILNSAAMIRFSWRATTFQFTNPVFTERFTALNEARLMRP